MGALLHACSHFIRAWSAPVCANAGPVIAHAGIFNIALFPAPRAGAGGDVITQGLQIRLDAHAGRDAEVENFLLSALPVAGAEPLTSAWIALRYGRGEYGVFAAFPSVDARDTHMAGAAIRALMQQSDTLFTRQPQLHRCAVLAYKLPVTPSPEIITKALQLSFKPKAGRILEVEQFLRDAKATVMQEPRTVAWFALQLDNGDYGIFDVFPDNGARFLHLTGHVPRELAKHSLSLLGGVPEVEMISVLGAKLSLT